MNRNAIVSSPGLLDRIVARKREEVAALRSAGAGATRGSRGSTAGRPAVAAALQQSVRPSGAHPAPSTPFDLARHLKRGDSIAVIAEVKRKSPSAGLIREDADPVATAVAYNQAGAAAISVLTDRDFFGGSLADLAAVAGSVDTPVLRKDFIIDELQIDEAARSGASIVLLITRLLDVTRLRELRLHAERLGLAALVEVHDARELEHAIESGASVIGVNNRNLDTLEIDLSVSERLLPGIPPHIARVAESGLRTAHDIARMANAGADAVLIGEALMRQGELAVDLTRIPRPPHAPIVTS